MEAEFELEWGRESKAFLSFFGPVYKLRVFVSKPLKFCEVNDFVPS